MEKWITRCVVKTAGGHNITVKALPVTGFTVLINNENDERIHIGGADLTAVANALLDIANEPTTVDGMTALKHIMDGGGAYRVAEGGEHMTIRHSPAGGRHKTVATFYYQHGSVMSWFAADLEATDWVLVP